MNLVKKAKQTEMVVTYSMVRGKGGEGGRKMVRKVIATLTMAKMRKCNISK